MPEMQEGEPRWSWCDRYRDTMEGLWGEKLQIKGGSLSSYSGLKPHVTAWGEHTAHMQRNPDVTCTLYRRHMPVSLKFSPPSNIQLSARRKKIIGISAEAFIYFISQK